MKVTRNRDKCIHCGMCEIVLCPLGSAWKSVEEDKCIGCGACVIACPENALIAIEDNLASSPERIVYVNGQEIKTSGFIKDALGEAGVEISKFPFKDSLRIQLLVCPAFQGVAGHVP
jgi:pyruvate formate lyase activating enzyme